MFNIILNLYCYLLIYHSTMLKNGIINSMNLIIIYIILVIGGMHGYIL